MNKKQKTAFIGKRIIDGFIGLFSLSLQDNLTVKYGFYKGIVLTLFIFTVLFMINLLIYKYFSKRIH